MEKGGKDHHSGELVEGGEKVGDAAASFHQHHQLEEIAVRVGHDRWRLMNTNIQLPLL